MFEKTDNVVVIIPEKYGDMYGTYLATLASWTGKGHAYMVYNSNSGSYEPDASVKESVLIEALRKALKAEYSAFKTTHVEGRTSARQKSFKDLFFAKKNVWQYANMVYALDQLGCVALVESQNMVARQVRFDHERMSAMTYRFDDCANVAGQTLAQCLYLTSGYIKKQSEPNFAGSDTADRLKYFAAKNAKTLEVVQRRTGAQSYGGNNFWDAFKGDYEYQAPTNVSEKEYALPGACWMDDYSRPHYLYCGSGNATEMLAYRDLAIQLFGNALEFNAIKPDGRGIG